MPAINDVTKDSLVSKYSESYRDNYDLIFRKPKVCQHRYSKSMNQEYPRKCLNCGETEIL